MTEYAELPGSLSVPELERLNGEARQAYVELLDALRAAIHLNEGAETVSSALESLMIIAECWAVARASSESEPFGLPFSRQSEIDLVATLLGLASYSFPFDDSFAPLREAFLETTSRSYSEHQIPILSR